MNQKRMPWDRPPESAAPNRQGDYYSEPIYTALGKALSGWEGVNAAANSLYYSLQAHLGPSDKESAAKKFEGLPKTHDRAQLIRQAAAAFLDADFGERRDEAAKFKKQVKSVLSQYVGWVARRNELAHGYVTVAQCPDYTKDAQPTVTVYALFPSHARTDRWYSAEPEWNYLAKEVGEFAYQFLHLDDALEALARRAAELCAVRSQNG